MTGDAYWRTVSRDNVTSLYGRGAHARQDRVGVDPTVGFERHRADAGHGCVYVYPKRITYANEIPGATDAYHFELVFDYGEHDPTVPETELRGVIGLLAGSCG